MNFWNYLKLWVSTLRKSFHSVTHVTLYFPIISLTTRAMNGYTVIEDSRLYQLVKKKFQSLYFIKAYSILVLIL